MNTCWVKAEAEMLSRAFPRTFYLLPREAEGREEESNLPQHLLSAPHTAPISFSSAPGR